MRYKHSLVVKVIGLVIGTLLLCNILSSLRIYEKIKKDTQQQIQTQIAGSLYGISANIDGDQLEQLIKGAGDQDAYYKVLNQYLGRCLVHGQFQYLYTVGKFEDGKFYYAVDSLLPESEDFSGYKTPLEVNEEGGSQVEEKALAEGIGFTAIQYYEEWGYLLTGYVAITNSKGETVALLGADVLEEDYNERINSLSRSVWETLILSLVGMTLLLGGYLVITLRPLRRVEEATRKIADGDFRVALTSRRKDEIGSMTRSFSHMVEKLSHLLCTVRQNAKILFQSSNQLLMQSEQLNTASEKVSVEALAIREYSEVSQKQMTEITLEMEMLYREIQGIAESTEKVYTAALVSYENAIQGDEEITQSMGAMTRTNTSLKQAQQQMADLGAQINQACQFIEQIGRIATQTRVLALNASIEAARVKEVGAGFQVVAREIGKLAENATNVAKETTQILGAIQNQAHEVRLVMDDGRDRMGETMKVTTEARQYFDKIVTQSLTITQDTQSVKVATQSYTSQIQCVLKKITEAAAYAKGLSESGESISEVSQEQLSSSEELLQCAAGLRDMSASLEEMVAQFKIREG